MHCIQLLKSQTRHFAVPFAALFFVFFGSSVHAADITVANFSPAAGVSYYATGTITFIGSLSNDQQAVTESGYADVRIDWNADNNGYVNLNANPDDPNAMMGPLSSGEQKTLSRTVSNAPIGNHRYRFIVDTAGDLDETNENNNESPWVAFSVVPVPAAPVITFNGTNPIVSGQQSTLTWTVTGATSCTGSGTGFTGSKNAVGDSQTVSPTVTTEYTLSCTGPGGSALKNFTVNVVAPAPTVNFSASVYTINSGSSTLLSWTTSNANSCAASGSWSGSKTSPNSQSVSPTTTSSYTLTCYGSGGTTTRSVTITVNQPLPVITITASPTSLPSGGTTTVTWSVTNATYCIGSNGPSSAWNSSKDPLGNSMQVSSIISRAYVLNCSNPSAGTSTNQVSVNVTGLPNLSLPTWNPPSSEKIHTSVASTSATPLTVNQANTLRAQVRNTGSSTTGIGFQSRFSGSWGWNQGETIGHTISDVLNVGQTNGAYDEIAFTPRRAGHIEVAFCADRHATGSIERITEQNESDNCTYRQFSVATSGPGFPAMSFTVPGGTSGTWGSAVMSSTTRLGVTTTLTWAVSGATSCTASSSPIADPNWVGSKDPNGGSIGVNPVSSSLSTAFVSYSLACVGPGGVMIKAIRLNTINAQPVVTLSASPASFQVGSSTTLTWTALNANTCTASSNPSDSNWTGSVSRNGGTYGPFTVSVDTQYTITCQSPSGTTIVPVNVDVYDPPPVITFVADDNSITPIDTTNLRWTVTGASTCEASGGWSGSKLHANGVTYTEAVSPDVTTMYTLECTGPTGSSATKNITISVNSTAPVITFDSSDGDDVIIENGSGTTFTWNALGATSCTASSNPADPDWTGAVSASSSKFINPDVSTTYTLTCTGPWGTTPWVQSITVIEEAIINQFEICDTRGHNCVNSSSPMLEIDPGTPLSIEWDVDDATNCNAVRGNGFSTGGSVRNQDAIMALPIPDRQDTYTIACGSAGYTTASRSITIKTNRVTPTISISNRVIKPSGQTVTVSWNTNNNDQTVCSIRGGGLGQNDLVAAYNGGNTESGSKNVAISGKTTFTVTCGDETDSATIELSPRIWGI